VLKNILELEDTEVLVDSGSSSDKNKTIVYIRLPIDKNNNG
jgi:hypothetical protein